MSITRCGKLLASLALREALAPSSFPPRDRLLAALMRLQGLVAQAAQTFNPRL